MSLKPKSAIIKPTTKPLKKISLTSTPLKEQDSTATTSTPLKEHLEPIQAEVMLTTWGSRQLHQKHIDIFSSKFKFNFFGFNGSNGCYFTTCVEPVTITPSDPLYNLYLKNKINKDDDSTYCGLSTKKFVLLLIIPKK